MGAKFAKFELKEIEMNWPHDPYNIGGIEHNPYSATLIFSLDDDMGTVTTFRCLVQDYEEIKKLSEVLEELLKYKTKQEFHAALKK